jgi:hypothetical protein
MDGDAMRAPGERAQGDVVEVRDGSGRVRSKTISIKRLGIRALERGRVEYPDEGQHEERPRTRGECPPDGTPCPWVSCKHHLYLDVDPRTGAIKLNYPHLEPDQISEPCALRVADRDGITLEEVGVLMNITRERVRQLEERAMHRVHLHILEQPRAYPDIAEHAPPRPCEPRPDPVAAPPPEVPESVPEHRVTRALHHAGWRKLSSRPNVPARWQSPDGRLVSHHTAYREAARMLTLVEVL